MARKLTKEDFLARARAVQKVEWDYSEVIYVDTSTKVTIICHNHGRYEQAPDMHMSGHGCPKCSCIRGHKLLTSSTEEFIPKLEKIYGDEYDLSGVVYKAWNQPITIGCYTHGPFETTPNRFLVGAGCTKCSRERKTERNRAKAAAVFRADVEEKKDLYDYSCAVYVTAKTPVEIICKRCNSKFKQTPDNHLQGKGCPGCAKAGFDATQPGILYILKCDNITKVGITNKSLQRRIRQVNKSSGKNFKAATFISFENGQVPTDVETELLRKYRKTHKSPTEVYDGYSECFYDVDYNTLLLDIVTLCSKFLSID